MIFENDDLTPLVIQWQGTRDSDVLDKIVIGSRRLVEAIVSMYEPSYRDDLIQESSLRIVYSLPYFNAERSKLHTFLTTVIHNACKTYVRRQYNYESANDSLDDGVNDIGHEDVTIHIEDTMMADCICRNRQRFPSLSQEVIDGATAFIIIALRNAPISKRAVVEALSGYYQLDKAQANVVYISTVVYLRHKYYTAIVTKPVRVSDEFSLDTDFMYVMGEQLYRKMSTILSGLTIRMP